MTEPNREVLSSYLREMAETPSDINEHLELLHSIVAETNAQMIVELGTRSGNSTSALVIGAAETGGRVTSVDHGQGSEYSREPPTRKSLTEASAVITEKLGLGQYWKLVVKDDLQFAREYDDEIDVLLIDTSHSYEQTRKELEAWGNKVVPGGFIVVHDTVSFPEQNKAIWEFLDNHPSSDYVEHLNCNGLGIIIKGKTPSAIRNAKRTIRRIASDVWRCRLSRTQEGLLEVRTLLNRALARKDTELQLMRTEQQELKERLEAVDSERSRLNDELNQTRTELSHLQDELLAIHDSFGYKVMKFYASRIDRLLPEGTRRGEFRKVVTTSLRIITEQGIRSYFRQACEKISRREFGVIDSLGPRNAYLPKTGSDAHLAKSTLVSDTTRDELSDENLMRNLNQFLSTEGALEFRAWSSPIVSIVIVTYNRAQYTFQCLRSLLRGSLPPHELIILDNASTDDTSLLLAKIRGARITRNGKDRFFGPACNQGASAAKGKYLLFLNNDAFVREGCIPSLVNTMESAPDVGAAGAKLIWRNGLLQEAGSIVWRDGRALGYGRGDDPSKPEYCYARDVDYCSAACLMVRRDLFESQGGFDESFTPAYYEDTDLCMRLWSSGYRVVYDPHAVAVHVEYAARSFDTAKGLMEIQRSLFVAKHKEVLEKHPPFSEGNVFRARSRKDRPTILVIDDCVPKPTEGSGFPRMFSMLKSMASLGYRVTLLPLTDATPIQPETDILTQMGVEVLWGRIGVRQLLESRRDSYDIVFISRPHNALLAMNLVRKTNPKARVIYDAEALWYRRDQLKRSLGYRSDDPRFRTEKAEMSLILSADYVVTVSDTERKLIQEKLGDSVRVATLGHSHAEAPTLARFEDRHDLLFLAGFKSTSQESLGPNDDAAIHFVKKMLPRIQEEISGLKFLIAGSNPPESVKRLASDSILVIGYVKDLKQLYESSRVFVAPIRFAAGVLWKVTEAMSYGLPCVLSTAAAQGLEIRDGEEALIARDEEEFVEKTVRLHQDKALWSHIREHGLEYVAKNCDPSQIEQRLDAFLKKISQSAM